MLGDARRMAGLGYVPIAATSQRIAAPAPVSTTIEIPKLGQGESRQLTAAEIAAVPGNPSGRTSFSAVGSWLNPFQDDGTGIFVFGPIRNPKALVVDAAIAYALWRVLKRKRSA